MEPKLPKWWLRWRQQWDFLSNLDTAISWTQRFWTPIKWIVKGAIVLVAWAWATIVQNPIPLLGILGVLLWVGGEWALRSQRQPKTDVRPMASDTVVVEPPVETVLDYPPANAISWLDEDPKGILLDRLEELFAEGQRILKQLPDSMSTLLGEDSIFTVVHGSPDQMVGFWEDDVVDALVGHDRWIERFLSDPPISSGNLVILRSQIQLRVEHRLRALEKIIERVKQ